MEFQLTEEITDLLIFGMENQEERVCFDTLRKVLVPQELVEGDEDRFLSLPPWTSAHGFRLMENFAAFIKNPRYKELLKEALFSGKGTFRKFKDVLKTSPELERLWRDYKAKEMRYQVIRWYNLLADQWGCEKLGPEPEETESLLLADFSLGEVNRELWDEIRELDRQAFEEVFSGRERGFVDRVYARERNRPLDFNSTVAYGAQSPGGDFGGFILGAKGPGLGGKEFVRIIQLYVKPVYRGLGLGMALLDAFLTELARRGITDIQLTVAGNPEFLFKALELRGFAPYFRYYSLDAAQWNRFRQ